MSKVTAIHSGGDWTDASALYVVVPRKMDIKKEHRAYQEWIRGWNQMKPRPRFCHFAEWLVEYRKARIPTEKELDIFDEMDNW